MSLLRNWTLCYRRVVDRDSVLRLRQVVGEVRQSLLHTDCSPSSSNDSLKRTQTSRSFEEGSVRWAHPKYEHSPADAGLKSSGP